jgi:hypothetical protein
MWFIGLPWANAHGYSCFVPPGQLGQRHRAPDLTIHR